MAAKEIKAQDIIDGNTATVAATGKLDEKSVAEFLNEFANTPARASAMRSTLDDGIDGAAFVDKFFPESPRAAYIAHAVEKATKAVA